jgi:hypothetical protein
MLTRRFIAAPLVSAAAAVVMPLRFTGIKSNDPTYEDDRWLEAEFATSAEMTQEERYAKQKQAELMRKILNQARKETQATVAAHKEQVDTHKDEIADLKKQMADLQAKLEKASKK